MPLNLFSGSVITVPAFSSMGEFKTQEYLPAAASFSQHPVQRPLTFLGRLQRCCELCHYVVLELCLYFF